MEMAEEVQNICSGGPRRVAQEEIYVHRVTIPARVT